MPIFRGTHEFLGLGELKLGTQDVKAVYRGTTLIWPVTFFRGPVNRPSNHLITGFAQGGPLGLVVSTGTSSLSGNTAGSLHSTFDFQTWSTVSASSGMLDIIFTNGNYTRQSSENGRWFFACGRDGQVRISQFAIGWNSVNTTTSEHLYSAVEMSFLFSNRIVCVGNNGRIVYNGTLGEISNNWQRATSNTTQNLRDVAINPSNNLLVAVGFNRTIIYSTNGISWTNASIPSIFAWSDGWSVAFGNGVFLAVDVLGRVLQSTDGINWTSASNVPLPTGAEVRRIRFIDGIFYVTYVGGNSSSPIRAFINGIWQSFALRNSSGGIVFSESLYGLAGINQGIIAGTSNILNPNIYTNFKTS